MFFSGGRPLQRVRAVQDQGQSCSTQSWGRSGAPWGIPVGARVWTLQDGGGPWEAEMVGCSDLSDEALRGLELGPERTGHASPWSCSHGQPCAVLPGALLPLGAA